VELNFNKVAEYVGLTPQQFDVLQCIYRLQEWRKVTSPKSIQEEYRRHTSRYLMKPNLFNILRILKMKGCIVQSGYGEYGINFIGIKECLRSTKTDLTKDLKEFTEVESEIEKYFIKLNETVRPPRVEYLKYEPFFSSVSDDLKKANEYYITAKFPGIAYTLAPYEKLGRGEYFKTLWERAIDQRNLKVNYLTCLDPEYPYLHSLRVYKKKSRALRECESIFNNLENITSTFNNINIFYIKNPYGLDIVLPEDKFPETIYMFIRDGKMEVTGGIHIISRDIATRAKETFTALCNQATLLKGVKGQEIIEAKRKELMRRYGGKKGD
jgi:hypothetical protein